MYLPLFMIDLRECFSNAAKKTIMLSSAAQLMVLFSEIFSFFNNGSLCSVININGSEIAFLI